jgi:aminomethyltransferase
MIDHCTTQASDAPLKHTPLHAMHVRLGGRMVPFAGYEMPVQYPTGIIKEHLHTRAAAGLFDVSHMGQIAIRPRSGHLADAAQALETLVGADILGLAEGRQRYALFTNAAGGILDDLMVANLGDHLRLVVNASRKEIDETHLCAHLADTCVVELLHDRALLALQGPGSEAVLAALAPDVRSMRFMDIRRLSVSRAACVISRSGYTGEDGFEISIDAGAAESLCGALLQDATVRLAGLGARDSLRLEAGLCLYGCDLDLDTTPVEAALEWAIGKPRRRGGTRARGFPGADIILGQIDEGAPRRRVGLKPEGRAPVRGGTPLFDAAADAQPAGIVSSGGFGISLNAPVAMGYVPTSKATPGTRLFAELRGTRQAIQILELPFVPTHYKR